VFLGYACAAGRALLDVRLYLPRSWIADPGRCAAAGIPADIEFATKPQLALRKFIIRFGSQESPVGWCSRRTGWSGQG
jgi:SRSO17 transposase